MANEDHTGELEDKRKFTDKTVGGGRRLFILAQFVQPQGGEAVCTNWANTWAKLACTNLCTFQCVFYLHKWLGGNRPICANVFSFKSCTICKGFVGAIGTNKARRQQGEPLNLCFSKQDVRRPTAQVCAIHSRRANCTNNAYRCSLVVSALDGPRTCLWVRRLL